jgi:plastocyanin
MNSRRLLSAFALAAGFGLSSVCLADITGTVKFDGEAPEPAQIDMSAVKECAAQHPDGAFEESLVVADGKLANVVVFVKADNLQGDAPKEAAVIDQKGCQYHPHVLGVMVGQPIVVKNDDNFLHNVHALSIDNPAFNFGQPTKDTNGRKVDPMKTAERFKIKCDVHPWMGAHIAVFEHPYFAVSKEDGTFKIPAGKLADGEYTLVAWHEKLGEQEAKVTVAGGKAEGAEFTFKAAAARADEAGSPAEVKLASLEKGAAKTEACCEAGAAKAKAVKQVAKVKAEQPQASAK